MSVLLLFGILLFPPLYVKELECEQLKNNKEVTQFYKDLYGPETDLFCKTSDSVTIKARITGYTAKAGKKGALGTPIRAGATAAVSRNCKFLLGHKVYIDQHGVFEVNDLTASWVHEKFEGCTVDIAKPSKAEAKKVGTSIKEVTRLPYRTK